MKSKKVLQWFALASVSVLLARAEAFRQSAAVTIRARVAVPAAA